MVSPPTTPLPPLLRTMCLVLVRTQGPVNLGMCARLCGNFGIADLRLVAPQCAVNCEDSRKFSTHARALLLSAPVFPTLDAALADCGLAIGTSARRRDDGLGAALLPQEVPALLARRPAARWALVLGNEADGLSEAELLRCQALVRLQTFGSNYSYNLSHAAAILLYLLAHAEPSPQGAQAVDGAPRQQAERLIEFWLSLLERFAYFRRTDRERFAPQLREMIDRLHLSTHDVQMLWGMLAQFSYFTFGDRGNVDQPGAG